MTENAIFINEMDPNNTGFNTLLDGYLRFLNVMESSKNTYMKNLKPFTSWINESHEDPFGKYAVRDYVAYLESQDYKISTIRTYLTAIKRFYLYLESEGLIKENYSRFVSEKGRTDMNRHLPLSRSQVIALFDSIPKNNEEGLRNYAMIQLMIYTGLRTTEVMNANIGDIQSNGERTVLWIKGKGHKEKDDFVTLVPEVVHTIDDYLTKYRMDSSKDEPLFRSLNQNAALNGSREGRMRTESISQIVKKSLRKSGIDNEKISAHSLRHTAITFSILGGSTLTQAMILGRHSSPSTTAIYVNLVEKMKGSGECSISRYIQYGE